MSQNKSFAKNLMSRAGMAVPAFLLLVVAYETFEWTFNRIYVPEGHSLVMRYKGPPLPFLPGNRPSAALGQFAQVDEHGRPLEVGILKDMLGPGRHFRWIGWWETRLVEDTIVRPGEVAIVSSKMGKDLTGEQFLVDGDLDQTNEKGILRQVFGPGTYRINDYAYSVEVLGKNSSPQTGETRTAGWVSIPTGYVGVVTNLTDNKLTSAVAGIQEKVLQPGLYPINPKEQHVDIIGVGFAEKSIKSNLVTKNGAPLLDESGEPAILDDDSGIAFPSNDGFKIHMDFTAVWGIMPDQAADVIRKFGNLEAVETKVVVPQIESICRNQGSSVGAVDLLVGDTRQKFQEEVSTAFHKVLEDKGLTLLHGFVRNIHIPQEVRKPIQEKFIADELKLTREQELLTARTEATLREAEKTVELEKERVDAETMKKVAQVAAEGNKEAEETKAGTIKLAAVVDRKTAELEAEASVTLGKAKAGAKQLEAEAKSELFKLAVDSFGSGSAYNQWVFATGLPEDVQLDLFYAGEGTLWTDLKGFTDVMLGREAAERASKPTTTKAPAKP
jgi:regulator of protease activity HflC (stomatin/prohibitin superfamily)